MHADRPQGNTELQACMQIDHKATENSSTLADRPQGNRELRGFIGEEDGGTRGLRGSFLSSQYCSTCKRGNEKSDPCYWGSSFQSKNEPREAAKPGANALALSPVPSVCF